MARTHLGPSAFAVALLLSLPSAFIACGTESDYEGPQDPCRHESFSCGSDMLHFYFTELLPDGETEITLLPDGEYHVTVQGDGVAEECTLIRDGTNDVGVPNYEVECESAAFESQVSVDRYGLSIFHYRPETITLTVESAVSGCAVSVTEDLQYEAIWDECGETCIEAFRDLDVSKLLAEDCGGGWGGAGGAGG
jgi:hypothetical protein